MNCDTYLRFTDSNLVYHITKNVHPNFICRSNLQILSIYGIELTTFHSASYLR